MPHDARHRLPATPANGYAMAHEPKQDRQKRLAEALRRNLARRKQAGRPVPGERDTGADETGSGKAEKPQRPQD